MKLFAAKGPTGRLRTGLARILQRKKSDSKVLVHAKFFFTNFDGGDEG